jgi:lipopolysaccharide biosynthesis glycosyltransferase
MNILIATSAEYVKYNAVMLESLYSNNQDEPIDVYVICKAESHIDWEPLREQANKYQARLIPLPVDEGIFIDFPEWPSKWPLLLYFKLLAAEILPPHLERILFLEGDMIVTKSLKHLYHMDFENRHIIACRNLPEYWNSGARNQARFKRLLNIPEQYDLFGGGVQVFNLNKWREDGIGYAKLISIAEKLGYTWTVPDESLFWALFYDSRVDADPFAYQLHPAYWQARKGPLLDKQETYGSIIHYAICNKPWDNYILDSEGELDHIWWEYAKKTPFYEEIRGRFEARLRNREDYLEVKKTLSNVDVYYQTIIRWKFMQDSCGIDALPSYLLNRGYTRIAVYGSNMLQVLLCNELKRKKELSVVYIVDSYDNREKGEYPVRRVADCTFADVDVIIVAAFLHYEAIKRSAAHAPCPILSLQDIVDDLLPDSFNKFII